MARVWDRFLTEQDREHLANSKHRPVGVGRRPAVLNIDLYRAVFGDENVPRVEGLKKWPSYCGPAAWAAIPHIQRLMKKAREIGVPVIHVTGLLEEESGVPGWSDAIHGGSRRGAPTDPAALERYARRLDIIDEVAPEPGEVVLKKTAPSAFWGTPLMAQLNLLHIDTLLVTGESVSGCVRASVVEAASYRFKVQVVEECVFDRHEACRAINLFDMNQKYADVISIDAAIRYLEGLEGGAEVRREVLVKG
jgi:nicotinamidase-related amidase